MAVSLASIVGVIGYVVGLATAPGTALIPPAALGPSVTVLSTPQTPTGGRASPSLAEASATATTAPPTWAFERTVFPLDEQLFVEEIWGLGDRVVGLASYLDSWYVTSLGLSNSWSLASAPRAIDDFRGRTVVDGRLWFLVHVAGLRPSDVSIRLAGTTGDENDAWKSFGKSTLDPETLPRWLGHIDRTWVIGYIGKGRELEMGAPQHLAWSRDGVRWSPANVPSLRGVDPFDLALNEVGSTRNVMVVSAILVRSDGEASVLLVSRNGIDWREVASPVDPGWASALTCNDERCVLTRVAAEDAPITYPMPIAWVSTDGLEWSPAHTLLADAAAGSGLAYVAAAGDGFAGLDRQTNRLWVSSPDGLIWDAYDVLPADLEVPIVDLAAVGHRVVALEQGPDVAPQGAWVGSLAGLRPTD